MVILMLSVLYYYNSKEIRVFVQVIQPECSRPESIFLASYMNHHLIKSEVRWQS